MTGLLSRLVQVSVCILHLEVHFGVLKLVFCSVDEWYRQITVCYTYE